MTQSTNETGALLLFKHETRKEWGVAVLIREEGGKRGYLFEDGAERTLANGYHQLMRRVEQPSVAQRAFYERQRALVARRESGSSSFLDQLERFHARYSDGFSDPAWLTDVRGEGVATRAARHRDALIRDAQAQLSASAIDALIKTQSHQQVWKLVTSILASSDLVPGPQLKKAQSANPDALRGLVLAVRELLHGEGAYEPRFDAYLAALTPLYGEAPHWEFATALSAACHPDEHFCVQPTSLRQQLKALTASGTLSTRASSAGYRRVSNIVQLISKKLQEQNQVPRDLFDVYDFVRVTLAPAAKPKAASKAPSAKARSKGAAAPG
jgi:hypothetical protein